MFKTAGQHVVVTGFEAGRKQSPLVRNSWSCCRGGPAVHSANAWSRAPPQKHRSCGKCSRLAQGLSAPTLAACHAAPGPLTRTPMKYYLWTVTCTGYSSFSVTTACLSPKKTNRFGRSPALCHFTHLPGTEHAPSKVGRSVGGGSFQGFSSRNCHKDGKRG